MRFYGHVNNDPALKVFHRKDMEQFIASLTGKNVTIDIAEHGSYSGSQWGYFHALCSIFAKEVNKEGNDFDVEKVKDMLRLKCPELREQVYVGGVYAGERLKSTKTLSKEEMGIVIERFKAWAAELGIYLPEPREQIQLLNQSAIIADHDKDLDVIIIQEEKI